jgi:uncharacterized membrane protein
MRDDTVQAAIALLIVAMICGTIVAWAYIAYNPKVCPLAEQHEGYTP